MTEAPGSGGCTLRGMWWWDIGPAVELERELFPVDPWTPGQFWSELAHVPQTRTYVVAEDAAGLAGYAGLSALPPDADVQTVAVAPRVAGRGVGRQLLDALLSEARRRGCTRVFLEVRADNAPARRLYDRLGFEATAVRRGYYADGTDAVVMTLRLGSVAPTARAGEAAHA